MLAFKTLLAMETQATFVTKTRHAIQTYLGAACE